MIRRWGTGTKKKDREANPQKQKVLEKHKRRPSRADRSEFPRTVVETLIVACENRCAACGGESSTTHHVQPRSRDGRGVITNGLRLCGVCHTEVHRSEEALQRWIDIFRDRHGDYFWYDAEDWETHNRQEAAQAATAAARRKVEAERAERIQLERDAQHWRSMMQGVTLVDGGTEHTFTIGHRKFYAIREIPMDEYAKLNTSIGN